MERLSSPDAGQEVSPGAAAEAAFPVPPEYRLEAVQGSSDGMSAIALDPQGRRVVLKPLPEDCLLGSVLHPMIKDRLGHIRDLAHLGVAQLYGVQAVEGQALLVWEYVEGQTLEAHLAGTSEPDENLARELILSLDALHALGIVHGALHERNVIVEAGGGVKLTHISPLLYTEPEADVQNLLYLLERMGIPVTGEPVSSLRELANRVMNPVRPEDDVEGASTLAAMRRDRRRRRRMIGLALAVAAMGAAASWGIWRLARLLTPTEIGAG